VEEYALKIGRLMPLVIVLIWFYLLIAVLVNPTFAPPSVPANPVMPFLSADAINLLWPIILLLAPIVVVSAQRLIQSSGTARREVSPQEFARIQARAHATSQSIRGGARRQESSSPPRTTAAVAASPESTAPTERPSPKLNVSEASRTKAKEDTGISEFTPPPTTLREAVFGKTEASADAGEASLSEQATDGTMREVSDQTADVDQRMEEMEAEKGAVSSLMTRLEEMKSSGTIEQELYDKLKKKYTGEIDKINNRIGKLAQKERKKVSKN
jgi:hypothetical protein